MPVSYHRPIITEFDMYITPDGLEYYLSAPDVRWSFSVTGTGMPPIEYVSQRGPFQHGETLLDYFLRPRVIQMAIRHNRSDRNAYWHQRLQILDVLRPNRQLINQLNQGTLRKIFPDGRKFDIDVMIQQGPAFSPDQVGQWDAFSFQEVIRFIAYNPIFYDPSQHSKSLLVAGGESLIFPLNHAIGHPFNTFDGIAGIVFDASSSAEATINYVGTWEEYPTIEITGPLTRIRITNTTTGDMLLFDCPLQAGDVVTINLTYGHKTVTLNDADETNLIGCLSADSDLATFRLIPGENVIQVNTPGAIATTGVTLFYYDRYIGY